MMNTRAFLGPVRQAARGARRRVLVLPLVIAGVALLGASLALADGKHDYAANTFINLNQPPRTVFDLHIRYDTKIWAVGQNPGGTFGKTAGLGTQQLDFSNGMVAPFNAVQIDVRGKARNHPPRIVQWWWTDQQHKPVGGLHRGCQPPDCTEP